MHLWSACRRWASRTAVPSFMRRRAAAPRERGMALVGAVVVLVLLAAATATTLELAGSELWAAGRVRSSTQARYTAEAGAYHAVALLAPGTTFAALLAGRGGLADPGEPGPLPFPGGGWVDFPGPPFGYSVTPRPLPSGGVAAGAPDRVLLVADATAVRAARHTITATVGRAHEPYAPAALALAGGSVELDGDAVSGAGAASAAVVIDGSSPADGAQVAVAALSEPGAASAVGAIAHGGGVLLGPGPSGALRAIDLEAYAADSGLPSMSPSDLTGPQGSAQLPVARRLVTGVAPGLSGDGLIVATGDLELRGAVDFHGVVFVSGLLRIDADSCSLAGMVWARSLRLSRPCAIRYDAGAVAVADRPLRLPRRAVLLALTDG